MSALTAMHSSRSDQYPTSVQLALARQDVKERESSDDGAAGRMTATARADIGARFEARPKSVGLGLRTDV